MSAYANEAEFSFLCHVLLKVVATFLSPNLTPLQYIPRPSINVYNKYYLIARGKPANILKWCFPGLEKTGEICIANIDFFLLCLDLK